MPRRPRKSALVLFCCVLWCVQYEDSAIRILHLNLVCLYVIAFACTNICYNHFPFIFIHCETRIFQSGFDGKWTENHLKFDNSYFKEMLAKEYADETTAQGCPQKKHGSSGTIMLISDLALLESPFKEYVELYAKDQDAFFKDYTAAWVKLQENGCSGLRDSL